MSLYELVAKIAFSIVNCWERIKIYTLEGDDGKYSNFKLHKYVNNNENNARAHARILKRG